MIESRWRFRRDAIPHGSLANPSVTEAETTTAMSTNKQVQKTPGSRTGGLTLRFAGHSVVLYTACNLSASKAQYLTDAKELQLFLTDEESDFTIFDEKLDHDAVSQKMPVGQSWG